MTQTKRFILTAATLAGLGLMTGTASAFPVAPAPGPDAAIIPVQQFRFYLDDGDGYIHDRHYDWNQYRNSTSRKERIRDYYLMQKEAEKDYWRAQKEMQKQMIKRQRGW